MVLHIILTSKLKEALTNVRASHENRTVEISVLQQLGAMHVFDGDVIPLVELIQERTRSNNKNTFIQDLCNLLENAPKMHVMVDFYKSTKLRSTTDAIREYVTMSVRFPDLANVSSFL